LKFINNIKQLLKFCIDKESFIKTEVKKRQNQKLNLDKELFVSTNKFDENDIFIIGFPKSGNTWMQTLMSCLLYGIDAKYMSDRLAQEIVPDIQSRTLYKRFGSFNFFKTHDLPKPEYKKVIYIIRDGRDAITSYMHFKSKLGFSYTIRDFFTDRNAVFPTFWHEHVKSWIENPYNSEILFVKYEDLIKCPKDVLKEIMKFVDINRSDDLLNKIIDGSSIDSMRKRVLETGGMGNKNWIGKKGADFFRKGVIGDYKNFMTEEEINSFNELSYNELKHFGYN